MPNPPPVSVLILYDPEEFWSHFQLLICEEIASAQAQCRVVPHRPEKAGLSDKPSTEICDNL